MWGVLRADFKEFVSTVTEDTSNALSAIDTNLDAREEDENGNRQTRAPLVDPDTGLVIDEGDTKNGGAEAGDEDDDDDDASAKDDEEEKLLSSERTPEEIWDVLCMDEATFTMPLVEDGEEDPMVASFLESFDISSKTDVITALLEEHADTLQATFAKVASDSDVSYEEFWKRYFYRCDDVERRIAYYNDIYVPQRLDEIESRKEERQNRRDAEAAQSKLSSLTSVTNFLGGAVKALVKDDTIPQEGEASSYFNTSQQTQQTTAAGLQFFNNSGRPPFVMNTAVEESFNDGEEDEDEEELGWDDDDDDEDDFDEEEEDDDEANESNAYDNSRAGSEQIEFNDAEKDTLKEELAQAIEERDQLHRTVEMQTQEIKALKEKNMGVTDQSDLERLKMHLFEKDAELAAMKARLDDNHEDESDVEKSAAQDVAKIASQEGEIKRLKAELAEKNGRVSSLSERLSKAEGDLGATVTELKALQLSNAKNASDSEQLNSQLAAATHEIAAFRAALEEAKAEKAALQDTLSATQSTVLQLQKENGNLKALAASADSGISDQLNQARKVAAEAQAEAQSLQQQLGEALAALGQASEQQDALQKELDVLKSTKIVSPAMIPQTPSSPGSDSTGVKVSTTSSSPAVSKLEPSENDEEDGWGDDW